MLLTYITLNIYTTGSLVVSVGVIMSTTHASNSHYSKYLFNSFHFKSLYIKNTGDGIPSYDCCWPAGGTAFAEISRAWQLVNWKVMYFALIIEHKVSGISIASRDTSEFSKAVWVEDRGTNVWL